MAAGGGGSWGGLQARQIVQLLPSAPPPAYWGANVAAYSLPPSLDADVAGTLFCSAV